MAEGTRAGGGDENGVMPVGVSTPSTSFFFLISLPSWLLPFFLSTFFEGCDGGRVVSVGVPAPFACSEIGGLFLRDAGGAIMAIWVGGGIKGIDAGVWLAGATRAEFCNEGCMMPFGASAACAFSEIG